ncbi:cysteine-rich secretory protein 2-like [Ctenocephalides felis]|uniref:cysteine-rich secretory protein 2-like n=1 Tax=Ctenocephalides felis TaxID=7515 RepID=UPI000E6E5B6B|nr:cysteine-rich secretory protein 2-like [Ctenocephalides felis]
MWKCNTIIIILVVVICTCEAWRYDRKPKVYGDKIPLRGLTPRFRALQKKIVLYHNFFRTKVDPRPANMLRMTWHKGAARAAQRWADRCLLLTHDDAMGRWDEDFGSCGQNIFVSSQQVPWFFAMKTWFLEKNNFTYGSSGNKLEVIGHYTQLVWDSTHKVGCGFAKCFRGGPKDKPYYNYVCNYCPIGNAKDRLERPYKRGEFCASCPGQCRVKKLCTNSCPYADLWINCRELHATWANWLCNTETPQGRDRRHNCRATCTCKGKIY